MNSAPGGGDVAEFEDLTRHADTSAYSSSGIFLTFPGVGSKMKTANFTYYTLLLAPRGIFHGRLNLTQPQNIPELNLYLKQFWSIIIRSCFLFLFSFFLTFGISRLS